MHHFVLWMATRHMFFILFFNKEKQKDLLEKEGHVIVQPNPDRRAYQVQNYKAALFDLDRLIIKE